MPTSSEISEQLARESERRARLGVPAFAGGFLYFLSAIIVTATLSSAPTVGLVQGLAPALSGVANPAVSPRAGEVKYISHHALALIAGSVVKSLSLVALTLILLLLLDATRFRRPQTWSAARPLVVVGGIGLAVVNVVHQVVGAIQAHSFAVGHDFSSHAVEQALTKGAVNVGSQYVDLLAALCLTAGMIAVSAGAIRVGLLTRWMGVIGISRASSSSCRSGAPRLKSCLLSGCSGWASSIWGAGRAAIRPRGRPARRARGRHRPSAAPNAKIGPRAGAQPRASRPSRPGPTWRPSQQCLRAAPRASAGASAVRGLMPLCGR